MFHPVGSRPSAVYWRRRFILLASVIAVLVLVALTVKVLFSSGADGKAGAAGSPTGHSPRTHPKTSASKTVHTKPAHPNKSTARSTTNPPKSGSSSPSAPSSSDTSTGATQPCSPSDLGLVAATNKKQYAVGESLNLSIKVTNKSKTACVVNLGDPQVLLKVYNGASRVWGSHDCEVTPGALNRTLMAAQTVKVSIGWSGLSAQPNCAGTRQRVGAGSYTLQAYLAGHKGTDAHFAIK